MTRMNEILITDSQDILFFNAYCLLMTSLFLFLYAAGIRYIAKQVMEWNMAHPMMAEYEAYCHERGGAAKLQARSVHILYAACPLCAVSLFLMSKSLYLL